MSLHFISKTSVLKILALLKKDEMSGACNTIGGEEECI
jgi:hypothetical protein